MQDLAKLKTNTEWRAVRVEVERLLLGALGDSSRDRAELQVKTLDETSYPGYTRRRISYFVDEWERVSAWLFVPEGRDEVPGILCCHRMIARGKDECAGIDAGPMLAFAKHYAELGYVTLAPDCITSGERVPHGMKAYDTRSFYKDYPKMSAIGKMLLDHAHALDALCETKRVDSARIGVVGHGLGACNALLLAAFDERVQACVAYNGFTRFADDKEPGRWAGEEGPVLWPQLGDAIKKRVFAFDWEHILALCAPSPTLVLTALNDPALSNTKSCEKAGKLAKCVYKLLGAADALEQVSHSEGAEMTPELVLQADDWFERWL